MPKTKSMLTQIQTVKETLTALYEWSKNFEPASNKNPFALFLDIIGYSDEILGNNLIEHPEKAHEFMGYTEYCMLGEALQVFKNNGYLQVYEACSILLASEEQQ